MHTHDLTEYKYHSLVSSRRISVSFVGRQRMQCASGGERKNCPDRYVLHGPAQYRDPSEYVVVRLRRYRQRGDENVR
jgi:hypothetical protein